MKRPGMRTSEIHRFKPRTAVTASAAMRRMRLRPPASTPITIRSASETRQGLPRRRQPLVDGEGVAEVQDRPGRIAGRLADEAGDELGAGARPPADEHLLDAALLVARGAGAIAAPSLGGDD